jgi:hypothetical protein
MAIIKQLCVSSLPSLIALIMVRKHTAIPAETHSPTKAGIENMRRKKLPDTKLM